MRYLTNYINIINDKATIIFAYLQTYVHTCNLQAFFLTIFSTHLKCRYTYYYNIFVIKISIQHSIRYNIIIRRSQHSIKLFIHIIQLYRQNICYLRCAVGCISYRSMVIKYCRKIKCYFSIFMNQLLNVQAEDLSVLPSPYIIHSFQIVQVGQKDVWTEIQFNINKFHYIFV